MIGQFVKGRVYVFIDAANIYHSHRKLGWKIAFLRLKSYFESHTQLGKIYRFEEVKGGYRKDIKKNPPGKIPGRRFDSALP